MPTRPSCIRSPAAPSRRIAETGLPLACNTPQDFASDYNLNGLYRRGGAVGQGLLVVIVTLAALDPGAPHYFWRHVGHIPLPTGP